MQPRPVPRGAVRRLAGPPQRGRQGLGRPARQGSPARALRLPPPWGKGVTGPRGLQQSNKAAAGEQVTPRVRRGLARGTSVHQLRRPLVLSSHALSPDICGWSGRAGRLPEVVQGGKGWGTGSATRTLGTRKGAITPCLWEAAGDTWWPPLASVPGLRWAELFTQDLASSFVAEEGRRCDTGPLCPRAWPDCLGFQSQEFGAWGLEQPVAEPLWDRGPSWLPSGPRLAFLVHQGTPHLGPPGPIQAHPEEVLQRDPGLGGGASLGTERWGHAWVPAPSQVFPLPSWFPPVPRSPTPTLPPKLRGLCHSTAEEPLVQPGVGWQG